jgi:ATP-dependent helicase YprA (DUF1998 family)
LLEIEVGEILAEYRPALNSEEGAAGTLVEVFLYDTLAGGAGFSPQLVSRGIELFETALAILEECPEVCDASCYRCVRSFRNRIDHALLDRHVGAQLLRHILTGGLPPFSKERAIMALTVLANDLERQFSSKYDILRNFETSQTEQAPLVVRRRTDGKTIAIDIHSPVTPGVPVFGTKDTNAIIIDEQIVRRHLGVVVEKIAAEL